MAPLRHDLIPGSMSCGGAQRGACRRVFHSSTCDKMAPAHAISPQKQGCSSTTRTTGEPEAHLKVTGGALLRVAAYPKDAGIPHGKRMCPWKIPGSVSAQPSRPLVKMMSLSSPQGHDTWMLLTSGRCHCQQLTRAGQVRAAMRYRTDWFTSWCRYRASTNGHLLTR